MERLDKFLHDCGLGTRKQVHMLLKAGMVTVDGVTCQDSSCKIDPNMQYVEVDSVRLTATVRMVLMLNKPAGYVTATKDPKEPTVMELLPSEFRTQGLKPVGRMDKEKEGLLLFTNDGAFLYQLISPKWQIPKGYYVRHEGSATVEDVAAFAEGLVLRDGTVCLPAKLESLGDGESFVTLCQGKYHQVRRMMAARGMHVTYLERQQEGPLQLGTLPRGQVRLLSSEEQVVLERVTLEHHG